MRAFPFFQFRVLCKNRIFLASCNDDLFILIIKGEKRISASVHVINVFHERINKTVERSSKMLSIDAYDLCMIFFKGKDRSYLIPLL
jgi:hypothetical protein